VPVLLDLFLDKSIVRYILDSISVLTREKFSYARSITRLSQFTQNARNIQGVSIVWFTMTQQMKRFKLFTILRMIVMLMTLSSRIRLDLHDFKAENF
jgi:hypothetical protein